MWLMAMALAGPAVAGDPSAAETFTGLVERMDAAGDALHDATWTMHSVERVRGELKPQETMAVKFRRPLDVYMEWIGDVGNGRQLLYREGWNNGRMRVNPEGLIPPMNLDPTGKLAMRDSRHPVMRSSILQTVDLFVTDMERIRESDLKADITDLGVEDVNGDASRCMRAELPRAELPELYADQIEACFSLRTGLPTRSRAYEVVDGELILVEAYEFADMQVNVGLTDDDFDPGNPDYKL